MNPLCVDVNWNAFGLGEQFWAVAVIIVGIAIALSILFTQKDIFYCLVVDWALLGILIKRLAVETTPDQSGLHPYDWTGRVRRVWRGTSLFC